MESAVRITLRTGVIAASESLAEGRGRVYLGGKQKTRGKKRWLLPTRCGAERDTLSQTDAIRSKGSEKKISCRCWGRFWKLEAFPNASSPAPIHQVIAGIPAREAKETLEWCWRMFYLFFLFLILVLIPILCPNSIPQKWFSMPRCAARHWHLPLAMTNSFLSLQWLK